MKIADLYVRVSTDEQADKGYSQRNQEEVLRKYCEINKITVRRVVYEDYSAKTFLRPAWQKLLTELKKYKQRSDLILFTKWDRFSRNAGDAYQMISILRKLGVEPQAIEQPLDLTIPENKMMLAFYLAAPEVENDRRALNVYHGMRRARKEGRFMNKAPVGYINKITESGKKYIAPIEPAASIMRWVFEELDKGRYAVEAMWKEALLKGLRCGRNSFWYAIRNPVYIGKVLVTAYKDEATFYADGLHEPIISEALFYRVQDFLDGKKTNYGTKIGAQEIFQLRGFLSCPRCGKLLTASASSGRSKKYYYYHCDYKCGSRFKAEETNEAFLKKLKQYCHIPGESYIETYALVLNSVYKTRYKGQHSQLNRIRTDMEKVTVKLGNARNLLLAGDLEADDYKLVKTECEKQMQVLEAEIAEASSPETVNIKDLIYKGVSGLAKLPDLYEKEKDVKKKRTIVGSIFPEKVDFDGIDFRTARLNEAVALIYKLGAAFSENKKGENVGKNEISSLVDP